MEKLHLINSSVFGSSCLTIAISFVHILQVKIDHTFNRGSEHRKTLSKVLPFVILPPTILLPPASTYTTFPHSRRPNRTGLLGRLRSGTERVPEIPPFGLDGFCAPAAATATFVNESAAPFVPVWMVWPTERAVWRACVARSASAICGE